jgi:hypothetical protein
MPTLLADPGVIDAAPLAVVPEIPRVTCPRADAGDPICGVTGTTDCPTDPVKQRTCPLC